MVVAYVVWQRTGSEGALEGALTFILLIAFRFLASPHPLADLAQTDTSGLRYFSRSGR